MNNNKICVAKKSKNLVDSAKRCVTSILAMTIAQVIKVQGKSGFTYTIQMSYFLNLTMSKLLWPSFPLTITFSKSKSFWSGVTATDEYGPILPTF